jgi:hypothetical protein
MVMKVLFAGMIGGRQHSEPLRSAAQIGDSSKTAAAAIRQQC